MGLVTPSPSFNPQGEDNLTPKIMGKESEKFPHKHLHGIESNHKNREDLFTFFMGWPTILTLLSVSCALALGTWQLYRLSWKENLIANVKERMSQAPLPLHRVAKKIDSTLKNVEFRPVTLSGEFIHEQSFKLQSQVLNGQRGYHLITPLITKDDNNGAILLVNRGWVPESYDDLKIQRPKGNIFLTGILRLPQKPSFFTPDPDDKNSKIYWIDPSFISKARNLSTLWPAYIVQIHSKDTKDQYPSPCSKGIEIRNTHLYYAATWYTLAFSFIILYIVFIRQRQKRWNP